MIGSFPPAVTLADRARMKPASFAYHAPRTVAETVGLLAEYGDDGKILAGGQSLVPAMNFRLARPAALIDINGVAELDYIDERDGCLRIGALARHAAFHRPVTGNPLGAFLAQVARFVAHLPIRVRGTFAGSLAHADPAAEWCAVAAALGAGLTLCGQGGERVVAAGDFFRTALTTDLRADEILTEIRLPLLDADTRCGFAEFSRRAGDFALGMAVAVVRYDGARVREARIGIGGATNRPTRIAAAEAALAGRDIGDGPIAEAAALIADGIDPVEDIHGSAAYRRHLAAAMTRRALEQTRPR